MNKSRWTEKEDEEREACLGPESKIVEFDGRAKTVTEQNAQG